MQVCRGLIFRNLCACACLDKKILTIPLFLFNWITNIFLLRWFFIRCSNLTFRCNLEFVEHNRQTKLHLNKNSFYKSVKKLLVILLFLIFLKVYMNKLMISTSVIVNIWIWLKKIKIFVQVVRFIPSVVCETITAINVFCGSCTRSRIKGYAQLILSIRWYVRYICASKASIICGYS